MDIREYAAKFNMTTREAFEVAWNDVHGKPCRCNITANDAAEFERTFGKKKPDYVVSFEARPTNILHARQYELFKGG